MRLEIEGLQVAYGRTAVLHGVDLDVPEGAFVCLMGRNGVGKTTLLNALMGLLPVRKGVVRIDGVDVTKMAPHRRARLGVGYVPQSHPVFPQLTARENLKVVLESRKDASKEALNDALDLFPRLVTLLDRPAGLLSGGQAQQLAIARTLVTRPTLLLFDEPTEGIQPSIIVEIEDAIAMLHKGWGTTVLLVEQYVEFALRLAERYAVMDGGEVVASGDTASADLDSFSELLAV